MRLLVFPVMALILIPAAACGSPGPARSGPSAATTTPPAATTTPPAATTTPPASPSPGSASPSVAACDTGPWRTTTVSVSRQVAVPPVPLLTAVRTGSHPECGYDRLVLDFSGALPSYSIGYVSQVTADPSGLPVTVAGHGILLITVHPAQAHTEAGIATIPAGVPAIGYRMLAGWARAGDFEGVVRLAVGVNSVTAFRVGELPGRLYIDVRW